jgi:ABC-type amino acid transport substrate-binding protein
MGSVAVRVMPQAVLDEELLVPQSDADGKNAQEVGALVQEGITDEKLAIAVRLGNDALRQAIDDVQKRLRDKAVLAGLTRKWFQQ